MSGVRCWNDIGIWGNSTCEKLGECVHCVNCGVYFDAAKELFERKIPSDYFDEWTESMERARGVSAGGGGGMFLFGLCGRLFALPSEAVSELASMRMIHKIPYRRGAGAAGLANIDGELVPTVDLAGLFGLDSAGGQFKCLVVCLLGGEKTAFPADFAKGSVSPDADSFVRAFPDDAWYSAGTFKFGGEPATLVDCDMLAGAVAKKSL